MSKFEVWERRPGGTWRSVDAFVRQADARDYMQRRIRSKQSLHFGKPGAYEYICLPVGDMPYPESEPYSWEPR